MNLPYVKPQHPQTAPQLGSKTREKLQIIDDYMHERISLEEYLGLVERQATWQLGHIGAGTVAGNAVQPIGRLVRFFVRSK